MNDFVTVDTEYFMMSLVLMALSGRTHDVFLVGRSDGYAARIALSCVTDDNDDVHVRIDRA